MFADKLELFFLAEMAILPHNFPLMPAAAGDDSAWRLRYA
jgi:hypothetical protein